MNIVEFSEKMKDPEYQLSGAQKCAKCKVPLQRTITGNRKSSIGRVCDDCWFGMFGEIADEHGIGVPHRPIGPGR